MKKALFAISLVLLAAISVFAQEVYTARASVDNDHPWTGVYHSNRFTVYYSPDAGDCASVTQTEANTALNELEKIFDVYMNEGFKPPYTATTANKYKMGVYVLRNGSNCTKASGTRFCGGTTDCSEGHAFGGTIGGAPGMWLAAGAVTDKWALGHEFMHGLQTMAAGMGGGNTDGATNFRGWFFESHANLMPHLVYPTSSDPQNGVHYCAEMYTRTAELYLGSTRNRYCNWQFFEYLIHQKGTNIVNKIWESSGGPSDRDPISEVMRQNNISQSAFGDLFGDFAMKAVIWDINKGSVHAAPYSNRNSVLFRNAFNKGLGTPDERFKRGRYTYLEALDLDSNRYVSPFAYSPQRYGYNIVRLHPDAATGTVTVKFRGDVQTKNNISSYNRVKNLEPLNENMLDNPGSDWRYGLVAVTGDASATGGTVTARYSTLMRASDGNPNVSIDMNSGESLYLVVAATPTVHHKISWDQFYYTIYRFPYMVEVNGAKPEGFQTKPTNNGGFHSNGGGFVASTATVAATAYVGPNARVEGTARVQGNARIEGWAVVKGGTVSGNAVVKDYAYVVNGTISDRAVISDGASIFRGTISGDAKVHGNAIITNNDATISENAQVGGVVLIDNATKLSGTAQLLGDGEVYDVTPSSGVYFGLVDAGVIGKSQYMFSSVPTEVTKPRSMQWYGDDEPTSVLPRILQGNALNAMQNSINLQVNGDAVIQIFNIKGTVVRTLRYSEGNYVIPLGDLPKGLYIARASSASWQKTVKFSIF